MKNIALFYHYQTALICLPSSVSEMDAKEWVQAYAKAKKSLLSDIKGDFLAGNLTEKEYNRLVEICDATNNI